MQRQSGTQEWRSSTSLWTDAEDDAVSDIFADAKDARDVLRRLVQHVQKVMPRSVVTCMRADEARGCLEPGPGCEKLPQAYRRMLVHLPLGQCACGRAAQERRIVIVEDTRTDPFWAPYRRATDEFGIRAVWSVPILFGDRLYGTYAVYHRMPRRPGQKELRRAWRLAEHAGAALAAVQLREQERQLRELNEALRDAQQMAHIGIWEADLEQGVSRWSAETCAIFGLPVRDTRVPHALLFERIHPEDREMVRAEMRAMARGQPFNLEYRIIRPNGEQRVVHSKFHRVVTRDGYACYRGTVQDITEQRHLEQQVQLAETMALIGRVAVSLADEIYNPLTAVRGFLQMLRDGELLSGDILDLMVKEMSRIEASVDRILALTSPITANPARIPVATWVDEAVAAVQALAEQIGVRIMVDHGSITMSDSPSQAVTVHGDARRLHLALVHILQNAVEASPPGSEVWVRGMAATLDGRAAWCIAVHDNGPGIPPEVLQRAGAALVTTKPQRAGIGLAAARYILSQHGGMLNVACAPQAGTTVTLTVPVMQAEAGCCSLKSEACGSSGAEQGSAQGTEGMR